MAALFLERPEGRVSYEDSGGSGPLVVTAPGMGDLRGVYRHVTPPLAEAGYRVVAMDLRGMGESSVRWSDTTDAAIASDYLALIDRLGSGPAVVVGNSLSAAAAVIAATDVLEAVAGLVLIGPFARDVPLKWWQAPLFKAALLPPWGRAVWLNQYRKNLYPGPKPPDHDDYVARLRANLGEPGRFATFRAMAANSHAESGSRLDRVTQPALIVMGTADPDFPDPVAEANYLAAVTGGEVLLVDGSGHYPQADQPGVVAPAMIALAERAFAA